MPADGFYEWKGTEPPKQPYYFHRRDDQPFAFAAIWERWHPAPDVEPVETCCLITTRPNATLAPVHNRMPVILSSNDYDAWLDPKASPHAVKGLLQPTPDDLLEAREISTAVNNVRNEGPELIEPESA